MGFQKTGAPEPVLRDLEQQKTAEKADEPSPEDIEKVLDED